jgi:hypothetical protein
VFCYDDPVNHGNSGRLTCLGFWFAQGAQLKVFNMYQHVTTGIIISFC